MSRSEKAKKAFEEVKDFIDVHKEDFGQAFDAAKAVYEKAAAMAEEEDVDIQDILTGDPVADRALLEAAGVEAEIESSGVSLEGALDVLYALARLGTIVAGIVA